MYFTYCINRTIRKKSQEEEQEEEEEQQQQRDTRGENSQQQ